MNADSGVARNQVFGTMSLTAYEKIKGLIVRNELDFFAGISEAHLVKKLKLSRTPVREALIMLERDSLLTREGQRGFRIRRFSVKDIKDLYEFRSVSRIVPSETVISWDSLLPRAKILFPISNSSEFPKKRAGIFPLIFKIAISSSLSTAMIPSTFTFLPLKFLPWTEKALLTR